LGGGGGGNPLYYLDSGTQLFCLCSITVVRLVMRDTIEERILALQERKKLVFEATVGQDNGAVQKLTEEDMRFLFSA